MTSQPDYREQAEAAAEKLHALLPCYSFSDESGMEYDCSLGESCPNLRQLAAQFAAVAAERDQWWRERLEALLNPGHDGWARRLYAIEISRQSLLSDVFTEEQRKMLSDQLGEHLRAVQHEMVEAEVPQPAPSAASVLREVEWAGVDGRCLICRGHEPDSWPLCTFVENVVDCDNHGHAPDCRLAAALRAEDSLRERMLALAMELEAPKVGNASLEGSVRLAAKREVELNIVARIRQAIGETR